MEWKGARLYTTMYEIECSQHLMVDFDSTIIRQTKWNVYYV